MKKTFIIFIILFILNSLYGQTQDFVPQKRLSQYLIDNWTKNEGLPTNSLLDIIQTDAGYI